MGAVWTVGAQDNCAALGGRKILRVLSCWLSYLLTWKPLIAIPSMTCSMVIMELGQCHCIDSKFQSFVNKNRMTILCYHMLALLFYGIAVDSFWNTNGAIDLQTMWKKRKEKGVKRVASYSNPPSPSQLNQMRSLLVESPSYNWHYSLFANDS